MTYVRDMNSAELAAHMKRLQKMEGWHDPLADRLFAELEKVNADRSACWAELKALRRSADENEKHLREELEGVRAELEAIKRQEPVAYRALFMTEDGAWSDEGRPWVAGMPGSETLAYFGDPVRADRWKIEYAYPGFHVKPTA